MDSPVLRRMVTGVNQASTAEAANRWSNNGKQGVTSAGTAGAVKSGSVRERARAYEQRYTQPVVSTSAVPSDARRTAKGSGGSSISMTGPATTSLISSKAEPSSPSKSQHLLSMPSEGDKENTLVPVSPAPAHTSKQQQPFATSKSRGNNYDLPSVAAERSNHTRVSTPLSPSKHYSTPPLASNAAIARRNLAQNDTSDAASRRTTVRAGAFQANRQRANSTPKPSEWMAASPHRPSLVVHDPSITATPSPPRDEDALANMPTALDPDALLYGSPTPIMEPQAVMDGSEPTFASQDIQSKAFEEQAGKDVSCQRVIGLAGIPVSQQHQPTSSKKHGGTLEGSNPRTGSTNRAMLLQDAKFVRRSVQMDRTTSAPEASVQLPLPGAPSSLVTLSSSSRSRPTKQSKRPRSMTIGRDQTQPVDIEGAFEEMIGTLNLSSQVARKMLALDLNVKTGMLKSATISGASYALHSSSGAASSSAPSSAIHSRLAIPDFQELAASSSENGQSKTSKKRPAMVRKMKSFMAGTTIVGGSTSPDMPDGFTFVSPPQQSTSWSESAYDAVDPAISQSAAAQVHSLKSKSLKAIDPEKELKKLRVLLRNEKLEWLQEWKRFGGYNAMMDKLHEVLSVEWREEQHDDAVLLELLKCFRGLLASDCGHECLASYSPSPFRPLIELLFSDKKPGDLTARQSIIEIMLGLFEVFCDGCAPITKEEWRKPWSSRNGYGTKEARRLANASGNSQDSQNSGSGSPQLPMPDIFGDQAAHIKTSSGSSAWESAGFGSDLSFASGTTHGTHSSDGSTDQAGKGAHALVRSLMMGPPNEKEEARVDFIQNAHKKRYFKLWVDEVIGVLSDYFWIFCHSDNKYWRLENIEQDKVEEPTVPGGMTGGVEYEAMCYAAANLRLFNQLARTCTSLEQAQIYHSDLFASGFDKIVLTLRKCSMTYYPQVHLELARYIDLCLSSGYPLHEGIRRNLDVVRSLSNNTLSELARGQDAKTGRPTHHRSRTEGQVAYRP